MQSNLLKKVSKNNIQLFFEHMNQKFLGAYYHVDGVDIILLNDSLLNNKKLLNCVLAEELGHFYTTVISEIPRNKNEYLENINYEKSENAALKWATNFMIPNEKLLKYVSYNQSTNYSDISDMFGVTKDFVKLKFYHMSLDKSAYKLNENAYLVLSNFPSIYIYEDINRSDIYGYSSKTR